MLISSLAATIPSQNYCDDEALDDIKLITGRYCADTRVTLE